MNRKDLQQLSRLRQKEAMALKKAGYQLGACYLLGYAVECALKACIAKRTQRYDFPDKNLANQAYVHNLKDLAKLAPLPQQPQQVEAAWSVVVNWSEQLRYETSPPAQIVLKDLYHACRQVLPWIRKQW